MENYFFSDRPTEWLLFILHGLGGSGKSQVAYKFVDQHKNRFSEVIFVDATSEETIKADLKILATAKKVGDESDDALSWLAVESQNWLMVFNNADNTSLDLQRFFPSCSHGNIIITTRNRQMIVMAQKEAHHQVSGLSCEDALQLLLKVSEAKGKVRAAGIALVEKLGYFALAIVQAAAYIRVHECSIQEYHKMYEKSRGNLLEEYKDCIPKVDGYEQTAYATWHACHRSLSPTASRLFNVFAFMHHSNISEDIFRGALSNPCKWLLFSTPRDPCGVFFQDLLNDFTVEHAWSKRLFLACVQELRSYSLVDFDPLTHQYSIHPLFQQWAKSTSQNIEDMNQYVAILLASSLYFHALENSYCSTIVRHIDALPETLRYDIGLGHIFAQVYLGAGRYKEAEMLQRQNYSYLKRRLGDWDPVTIRAEEQLATICWAQGHGRGADVVSAQLRLVELHREEFGNDGIRTIEAKESLAHTYAQQEQWSDAEKIQVEVLKTYTNTFGAADSRTCTARLFLVRTYLRQGKMEDAERTSGEVEKDEILADDELNKLNLHHFVRIQICAEQKKWGEAAKLQEEVLELTIRLHGDKGRKTLHAQQTLALILSKIPSRLAEAGVLAKGVAESYEQMLGGKDPVTWSAKHYFSIIRGSEGYPAEAETLLREILEAGEQRLEATHPEILAVRLSLSANLMQQKRWSEAEQTMGLTRELEQALRAYPHLHLQFLTGYGVLRWRSRVVPYFRGIAQLLTISAMTTATLTLWTTSKMVETAAFITFACGFVHCLGLFFIKRRYNIRSN
ncbi:hypothetical protein FRC09_008481 [Ceratobasidium sp. 395]|nr:hypothetical protein FRC09_008481 [Ceratobasidium sp. 395]